ncbi:MAG TPA: acetamidase [Firmicutes bacterium]|nr:acetamidase [Candidatus Fermentithermobacillaceae bacterium]
MTKSPDFPPKTLTAGQSSVIYELCGEHTPVMTAVPGENVVFEVLDCFGGLIKTESDLFDSVGWERINPATGPLFIEGAEPGDTLAVEIKDIEVGDYGIMTAVPGMGARGDLVKKPSTMIVPVKNGLVYFGDHLIFEARPMIGVIGTAPATGSVPTGTPGPHGGNMDTRVIVKGSTVYLPVFVRGALLAIGDLHALMGDGEVLMCGVEIPGRVTISTRLLRKKTLPCPVVETGDAYYTVHSAQTLDEAASELVGHSVSLMATCTGRAPEECLALLSIRGNLQISQIVDPLKTVRMEIPKSILGSLL